MAVSPMARPHLTSNDRHTNIFQPPALTPAKAPASNDYFSSQSRKRPREESSMGKSTYNAHEWACKSPDEEVSLSTESLQINDRYKLKGGFDTPGLLAARDLDTPADLDLNARRTMVDPAPALRVTDPSFVGPLARERNGFARPSSRHGTSETSPSWTRLALTLPFSIAGKMFSFGTTVLKGFYAGEGQGFDLDSSRADLATPVPGSWYESPQQDSAFMGDFEQDNTPTARPPPNKRRLTDKDSWVMVGTPDVEETVPTSPRRRPITPRRPNMRTTSRRSLSRRHSQNTGGPAVLSPQTSDVPRLSLPLSPVRNSPRSATYNSPDAERFARRQAKQERAADKTMNSMSRQLEELIRQGQAALGTKFSIEDKSFDDEGFVDDDY